MKYTGSIKNRLIGIILLITTSIGVIGYSSFVYWFMQDQQNKTIKLSKTIGEILGQDFAKLVLLNDISAAADISSQLKHFENIKSMVLYKLDKKVIFQYNTKNETTNPASLPKQEDRILKVDNRLLQLYIDAKYENTHLGYIELSFEIESLQDILKKDFKALFLILLISLIFSYFLANYFANKFTKPILNLVEFLEKIKPEESLDIKIISKEKNEFGKLYEEVNAMLEKIDVSQKALKIAAVAFETQSGIMITNDKREILQVNKAFSKITGYESHEVISKTPSILKSGLQDDSFYENLLEDLRNNNFWRGEIKNKNKNGDIVNEYLTIQSVLNENNEPIYYVASFLDITKQKETENKLQEKERILIHQSKMAAMGEMIGNIAHQWRQPLSIISSISSSLQLKSQLNLSNIPPEDVEQLKKVNETINYLSQTIEDFREFFSSNKEKNIFNVKDCYKKCTSLLLSKFQSYNIEFIEDIEENANIFNLENELMQVIMNILNNSKDAIENKRPERKLIFIKISKEHRRVIISIKDNGGGIPKEIIDKIFEPYFTTKHQSQGTGIGLYMSQEMVNKHLEGELEVENKTYSFQGDEYTGACFKIVLPVK
jgi:PAS domain S-box-containing protein